MRQAVTIRATSFMASAAILAALAVAALTMTITLRERGEQPSAPLITLERPAEPPIERPREPARQLPRPAESEVAPLPFYPATSEAAESLEPLSPIASFPATITQPTWLQRPRNLQSYYPRRALLRGVEGDVLLNCRVSVSGALDCDVAAEAPTGWGFGEAALRIARDHRMVPATRDGAAVEARYTMRVPFRVE